MDVCVFFFPLKKIVTQAELNLDIISVGLASWLCLHCTDCHFSLDTVAYFLPNLLSAAASEPQRPVDGSLRQKASLPVVGVCEEWYPRAPHPPLPPLQIQSGSSFFQSSYKCLKGKHSFLALLFAGVLMGVVSGGGCGGGGDWRSAAKRSILLSSADVTNYAVGKPKCAWSRFNLAFRPLASN